MNSWDERRAMELVIDATTSDEESSISDIKVDKRSSVLCGEVSAVKKEELFGDGFTIFERATEG